MTVKKSKRSTMGIIGNPNDGALSATLAAVLIGGAGRRSKRTQAERDELEAKRQAKADEEVRQARILKNICPDCSGKLVRGQKQKQNDYKRAWNCTKCTNTHSM